MLDLVRLKNKKTGQITMFVIIGIVILAAIVGIIFTFYQRMESAQMKEQQLELFNANSNTAREMVQNCIDITSYDALKRLGHSGGYTEVPPEIKYYDTAIWNLDQVNIQPSLDEIEQRMKDYIKDNVGDCIDFTSIPGVDITTEDLNIEIVFAAEEVSVKADYPVTVRQGERVRSFSEFGNTYNIRFRRLWELSSIINNNVMDPYFNASQALANITTADFDASYSSPEPGYIIFKIEDRTRYNFGQNDYYFRFAFKDGDTDLATQFQLQDNFEYEPTEFVQTAYSPNRDAQLTIYPGTTFTTPNGEDTISIRQLSLDLIQGPNQTFTGSFNESTVPVSDVNYYILDRPVYEFGPDGLESSQPMRLQLHWDDTDHPIIGPMGILTDHGGYWHPIDSTPVYNDSYIYTEISGFSNITTIDCGKQPIKLRISLFPWSNMIPFDWLRIKQLGMPIPLSLSPEIAEWIGLFCVDVKPACDEFMVILKFDIPRMYEPDLDKSEFINDISMEGSVLDKLNTAEGTELYQGNCYVLPKINETIEDFDEFELEGLLGGDEMKEVGSLITVIASDLGLYINVADFSQGVISVSAVYLQGGHQYKMCAAPPKCTRKLCLTGCLGIYDLSLGGIGQGVQNIIGGEEDRAGFGNVMQSIVPILTSLLSTVLPIAMRFM